VGRWSRTQVWAATWMASQWGSQRWGVGQVEVVQAVDGHGVIERGGVGIDAFGDLGAAVSDELGAEEFSAALVAGDADVDGSGARVVGNKLIQAARFLLSGHVGQEGRAHRQAQRGPRRHGARRYQAGVAAWRQRAWWREDGRVSARLLLHRCGCWLPFRPNEGDARRNRQALPGVRHPLHAAVPRGSPL
jgi:hypothetical protein